MKKARNTILGLVIIATMAMLSACNRTSDSDTQHSGASLKVTIEFPDDITDASAISASLKNIKARIADVQGMGNVNDAQKMEGNNRYCFEIWNVKDTARILNLMTAPGVFEVMLPEGITRVHYRFEELDSNLGHRLLPLMMKDEDHGYWGKIDPRNADAIGALLAEAEKEELFDPSWQKFLWSKDKDWLYYIEAVDEAPRMDGSFIQKAEMDNDMQGNPCVLLTFNSVGKKKWTDFTGENIGFQVACVMDDIVYSAPIIISEISGGKAQITGIGPKDEVAVMCAILSHGPIVKGIQVVDVQAENNDKQ